MKRQTVDDDKPRRLTPAELNTRRKEVVEKLPGLTINQELDTSDAILTECVRLWDQNRTMCVPWEKCTARCMETVGVKRIELWEKDPAAGFLRQRTATSDDVHAPLAEHLQVDYALRRRGLALAMADLVDWHVHERLREDLMASLARPPPPGYAKVDLAQVRRADETAFQLLARLSVDGIRRLDGKRPLDELIPLVMGHRGLQHGVATFAWVNPAASSSRFRSSAKPSWKWCLAGSTQEEGTDRAPRTSSPSSDGQ